MATKNAAPAATDNATTADEKQAAAAAAPTAVARGKTVKGVGGMKFKITSVVTVPVIKLMPDAPVYVKPQSKMEVSKQIKNPTRGAQPMEPATTMHCVDLQSGGECTLIVGAMLKSVFEEKYPEGSYVGKSFQIVNHGKRGDKKYNAYSVNEVVIDDTPDEPAKNGEPAAA